MILLYLSIPLSNDALKTEILSRETMLESDMFVHWCECLLIQVTYYAR